MPENTSAPNIDIDTIRVKTETRTPTPTALVSPNHKDAGSTNDNDIIHETKLNAKDTNQQEDTSCNRTECETPVSSPEQEMVVTRKMKQEQLNTMSTRTSFTDTDTDDSAHERADTGAVKSTDASDSGAEADKDKDPKETQEKKDIDFSNWPTENVKDPCINDVLYGRGGGTNHHEGNKRYRKMVESRKVDYSTPKDSTNPSSHSTSSDYGAANPLPADFSNTTIKPISGAMWGIKRRGRRLRRRSGKKPRC